jgi:hypothetical protein
MKELERRIVGFVVALICAIVPAFSQGGAGSGYSRFGIGEVHHFTGERGAMMGGASIGLVEPSTLSVINPATWTRLNRVRFAISLSYDGYSLSDNTSSTFLSSANFNGVAMAVPISPDNGITLGTGLIPYSRANFNVRETFPGATFPYTLDQSGGGGLSTAYIGLSMAVKRDWNFGLKFNYLFGTVKHVLLQNYEATNLTDTEVARTARLSGAGVSFGVVHSGISDLLGLSLADELSGGAVFTTSARMTTRPEDFYEYTANGAIIGRDTVSGAEGTVMLPYSFGVGIGYTTKERYILAADLFYQNWRRFTSLVVPPAKFRDSYRISIGGEISPIKDATAEFWERTAYRMGFFYEATNVRIGAKGIDETGITGGVSLPLFADTRLNVGIEYAIRGTLNIERDNIIRVTLTLNSGELWFLRPPEE